MKAIGQAENYKICESNNVKLLVVNIDRGYIVKVIF